MGDFQIQVECCDALRPDQFLNPKTCNGGPATKYATIRVDYLRGLIFENTDALLRTRKKDETEAFRKALVLDIAMVTEKAFELLYASAKAQHRRKY